MNPGIEEVCNDRDDDCDGDVDEIGADGVGVWYLDHDGDGWGDALRAWEACGDPKGYSAAFGDCDDTDDTVHPGAVEVFYDGVDQDCDGGSDYDADQDGHDAEEYGGDDCDDANSDINPSADETWYDGVDDDCDGNDDDQDEDGWTVDEDCDDEDAEVFPGAEGWTDDCEPVVLDTADTGLEPEDTGGENVDEKPECGCASGAAAGGVPLALLLLGVVGVVRRRERAALLAGRTTSARCSPPLPAPACHHPSPPLTTIPGS